MFFPYHFSDGLKGFSSDGAHKGWKYYQLEIHSTYHGGNIETDHHFICLIPEDVPKPSVFPKFTALVSGTLRGVLDSDTTTRDKIYLNGLGVTKVESIGLFMILKTEMEVSQYYTVFN